MTVTLTTDRLERMEPGSTLFAGDRALVVESARGHRDGWIVGFTGVADRDAAEALRGRVLAAEALAPRAGEVGVHEIVGREVHDTAGRTLGSVRAVEANPASDLLVLDGGVLVPATFVVSDDPGGPVIVDVPPGLLDVNR